MDGSPQGSALNSYMRDIFLPESNPLGKEEEREIVSRAVKGDKHAIEKLLTANLRFVISVAKEYRSRGLEMDDLIQEGNLGMVKAIERFDEKSGYRFITYAVWWIRQSILKAIQDYGHVVKFPTYRKNKHPERFIPHLSLDTDIATENEAAIEQRAASPEDVVIKRTESELLERVICRALKDERELFIVKSYYGLTPDGSKNLREIGAALNLTKERVRQIKFEAQRKIRREFRRNKITKMEHLGIV